MYYPLASALKGARGANVDEEEPMRLLTTYKQNLLAGYKKAKKDAADVRKELKDQIFRNLCFVENYANSQNLSDPSDLIKRNVVYYLCGYLLHSRVKLYGHCQECNSSLLSSQASLPVEFDSAVFTNLKNRGGLKYCSELMFHTFLKIESNLEEILPKSVTYIRESFEVVIDKITKTEVPKIGCDMHREELLPKLILEYVVMRHRQHSRRWNKNLRSHMVAHSLSKQAKTK